jgi:hypothetical protein
VGCDHEKVERCIDHQERPGMVWGWGRRGYNWGGPKNRLV